MDIGEGISGATFSKDKRHRFSLWRVWDKEKGMVLFIGLNPSKADEVRDDPTVKKCALYAKSWGYGGLFMGNCFSLRSSLPEALFQTNPVDGLANDEALKEMESKSKIVIACWGRLGCYLHRSEQVYGMFPHLYCLGTTKSGEPSHPLYLPLHYKPELYLRKAKVQQNGADNE